MCCISNNKYNGNIIWITGLSGAGKSTLGREVVAMLRNKGDVVVYLDGDQLREIFGSKNIAEQNYDRNARLSLAMQYSSLSHALAKQGVVVVITTISMFKEVYEWNRKNLSSYFEVFLKVPIDELQRRDSKNIYRRFDQGILRNVAGLDLKVDEPEQPDLLFDFSEKYTTREMAAKIISKVK